MLIAYIHLSKRSSFNCETKTNESINFNEKQRAIHIDHSTNREEASLSLMIMHNMSRDDTSPMALRHLKSKDKVSNPQQVIQNESFYHSTKVLLQAFMATTYDSLLF